VSAWIRCARRRRVYVVAVATSRGGVSGNAAAASGPVWPVDLHHAHVVAAQVSSQRGAVGAGPFHPCPAQHPEVAGPGHRVAVGGE
jgi:hypothetical protein